jgi:hypothetical protein
MRSCGWRALKSRTAAQCAETSTLRHTKENLSLLGVGTASISGKRQLSSSATLRGQRCAKT